MLERIISRGAGGAERAALEAARSVGLLTGGQSRPGIVKPAVARRFGLAVDACSAPQARAANARRAEGTLVVGLVSERVVRRLGPRVFFGRSDWSGRLLAEWVQRHGVRTLNVVGGSSPDDARTAGRLVLGMAERLGRQPPSLPAPGCAAAAVDGRLHAVRLWPTPRAWAWRTHGWVPYRHWERVVAQASFGWDDAEGRGGPTRRLARLLPPVVRSAVVRRGRIDSRLLAVFARQPGPTMDLARGHRRGVLDLLVLGPILLICDHRQRHQPDADPNERYPIPRLGRRVLRRLLRGRQRDLLGTFGFPPTESAVRAIARLSPGCGTGELDPLRHALRDPPRAAALRHVRTINGPVLDALGSSALVRAAAPSLWAELSRLPDGWTPGGEPLGELAEGLRQRLVADGSLHTVRQLLDTLAGPTGDPPPPPPAGVPGQIDRLSTAAELGAEGEAMRHCVARYGAEVAAGWRAVYRVGGDPAAGVDRATLMLRPSAGGRWEVDQFAGHANGPVSPEAATVVAAWLLATSSGTPARPSDPRPGRR